MSSLPPPRLIPEWAEQSAVLIAWPDAEGDFGPWFTTVEETYIDIAREISRREILLVACRDEIGRNRIGALLAGRGIALERLRWAVLPYDDVWVRDTAPLSIATAEGVRLLDFRFNAWGGKYPCAADAAFARNLHATGLLGATPLDPVDFVLEGGSIDSDGQGTLLTTRRCLLNPNRNPSLGRPEIEGILRDRLGAERILWLDHGHAEGDDTDAHVDTLARFCSEDTIAYSACDRPDDPLYPGFRALAEQLGGFRNASGRAYELVPLPIPRPIHDEQGNRLPATYANFLIINGAVLVPVYDDPADRVAMDRLATVFPGREMVPVNCRSLIHQYGSLHCMTLQFPLDIKVPSL